MPVNRVNQTLTTTIKPARSQIDDFIETARKLECDEDEARFKEKLGKIAKAKVATASKDK